jgi:non-ribosomal peptide synthetase component F
VRQYREFAAWQQARVTSPAAAADLQYWRERLDDARIFALPTDRPAPERHTQPCSAHNFAIGAEVMAAVSALGAAAGSATPVVLLAAFNVLAHQISGTTDPVIDTITTGRGEPTFHDTVGTFLNFLPLRTDVSDCASFRDILARTRQTCLDAAAHEIPIQHIEHAMPELMRPYENPMMSEFIVGFSEPWSDGPAVRIADSSYEVQRRTLQEPVSSEIPHGLAWIMDILPSGEVSGSIQYNRDQFDERTVTGWASAYRRILSAAAAETRPDMENSPVFASRADD